MVTIETNPVLYVGDKYIGQVTAFEAILAGKTPYQALQALCADGVPDPAGALSAALTELDYKVPYEKSQRG